jgi:hypothetical protein
MGSTLTIQIISQVDRLQLMKLFCACCHILELSNDHSLLKWRIVGAGIACKVTMS